MIVSGTPEGSQCFYKGQHCKTKNGKVFVYRGDDWVFTKGITADQVENEIRRKKFEGLIKPRRKGYEF